MLYVNAPVVRRGHDPLPLHLGGRGLRAVRVGRLDPGELGAQHQRRRGHLLRLGVVLRNCEGKKVFERGFSVQVCLFAPMFLYVVCEKQFQLEEN